MIKMMHKGKSKQHEEHGEKQHILTNNLLFFDDTSRQTSGPSPFRIAKDPQSSYETCGIATCDA